MLTQMLDRSELWAGMIDFLFPPICVACGSFDEEAECLCVKCLQRIVRIHYPVCLNCEQPVPDKTECEFCGGDSLPLYAFGEYTPPLNEAIIQFKFKGIKSPAKLFAGLVAEEFGDQLREQKADYLLPIPLHPARENFRGYNQAALFADELSQILNISTNPDLIIRAKKRKPQARLDFRHRSANIRSAFKINRTDSDPFRIILVDDVVTSGATIKEARRVLTEAGHIVTAAVSIAHAS